MRIFNRKGNIAMFFWLYGEGQDECRHASRNDQSPPGHRGHRLAYRNRRCNDRSTGTDNLRSRPPRSLIGPVFESKVQDWDAHIGRLCTFWSSVALMSGRYHGQPMTVHLPLPIDTPHFDRWLEIFAATARDVCPPPAAAHFLDRASRIAHSLELDIAAQNGEIRPKRTRSTCASLPARPSKIAR
jgi:truncated hemoglobin YjbI